MSLKRTLKHSLKQGLTAVGSRFSYSTVNSAINACARVLPGRLYGHQDRLLAPLIASLPVDEQKQIRAHSIQANLFGSWRLLALANSSSQVLDQIISCNAQGLARLQSGRPTVLVNSHYGMARFVPSYFARKGLEITTIEAADLMGDLVGEIPGVTVLEVAGNQKANNTKTALVAKRAIDRGEIVHLAADGFFGTSGQHLPFLSKSRRFSTGFAEIAMLCKADIVPVFMTISPEGNLVAELLDPLDTGDAQTSKQARVDHIVRQYVNILERRWQTHCANVRWVHLRHFQNRELFSDAPETNIRLVAGSGRL